MSENKLYIETPLILSEPLSRKRGKEIYLKLEALQPSASFKNRGIGHYCAVRAKGGAREFVCSSGGNAGLAAAFAARQLKLPITVVVPESTPTMMIQKIREQGAKVIQEGVDWQEADRHARSLCQSSGSCYVPPFDDPLIWEGNATLIHEVAKAGVTPDVVVVAVGGGGLFCGVLQGMCDVGWAETPVIAVETQGTASFAAAKAAGKVVELDKIESVAKSLGARAVCQQAVDWSKVHPVRSEVVSDKAALAACQHFARDHRLLVEPACGAALSLCYDNDTLLQDYKKVLVVVCGGACIS